MTPIESVWQAVFGERLPLDNAKRRIGPGRVKVVCPFHEERSASCTVNVTLGAFKCFGCGATGGYLEVVILAGNAKTKYEARQWLERRGVKI